jgi:transcriptional regulator with XRE-family HTH domain
MFYAFNSREFGQELKKFRLSLRLSQPQVSNFAKISVDGLRKIENGYVTPRFETLIKLSSLYKVNLIRIMSDYSKIHDLNDYYNNAQKLIDNSDIDGLILMQKELNSSLKDVFNNGIVLFSEYEQFLIFCETLLLFFNNTQSDLQSAKLNIIKALSVSIEKFNIQRITLYTYNQFELRFIHLLALVEKRLNNFDISIELLKFLLTASKITKGDPESVKAVVLLYFSLSYSYFENKDYEKSLIIANEGLEFSIQHQRLNELHTLYYRKGIAEYLLGVGNYMNSLTKSIILLESVNSPLATIYREVTLEKYGISLN